jgi:hypothetical protein
VITDSTTPTTRESTMKTINLTVNQKFRRRESSRG